jgi:hypothetical protein
MEAKMIGENHVLVANLALVSLPTKERHILFPRWGGIEAGATLSDQFRIMWEPEKPGDKTKQLVHRCYVDSPDSKDHGCVTRAMDHAEGTQAFICDFLSGELDGAYSEDEFLENLGMFLGVESHHLADLCTPVHVGHKIDFRSLGFPTLSRFHSRVERDIGRLAKSSNVRLPKPKVVPIGREYYWKIARETYQDSFLKLPEIYGESAPELIEKMVFRALSAAVQHTADVWHTVLSKSGMTKRTWSMQPLL